MTRPETTKMLSELLEAHICPHNDPRVYWAKEVTFDLMTEHPIRVDYMKFISVNNTVSGIEKGDFYCFEVKSSVEDFNSKNGHNFIGDLNYYVMTKQTFETVRHLIPYNVGVYAPADESYRWLECVKKARRKDRQKPCSEMLLMMFRSFARDARR